MVRRVAAGAVLVLVGGVAPVVSPPDAPPAAAAGTVAPWDFDGDGYADLAVGIVGEDIGSTKDAGAVQVLYGSASGATARDQLWHQRRKGIKGAAEAGDQFGAVLASGDFDADGHADLAIGIPFEDIGSIRDAGAVQVLYGSPRGLTARDQLWHQGSRGIKGTNEAADRFGYSLAAGDFDGDGRDDLAIGVAGEAIGSVSSAGRAAVLYGGTRGLTARDQTWRQGKAGLPSGPAQWEQFGHYLAAGDLTGDGRDDLAIVTYREADTEGTCGELEGGSTVHLLKGSPGSLAAAGNQYIKPADLGLNDCARMRATLGDLDKDGRADLVLGLPDGLAVLHGGPGGVTPAALPGASTVPPGTDAAWGRRWDSGGPDSGGPRGLGSGDEDFGARVAVGDVTGDGHPDVATQRATTLILGTAGGLGTTLTRWDLGYVGPLTILPLSGPAHAWVAVQVDGVAVAQATSTGQPGPITTWTQDSPGIKGATEPGDAFGSAIGPSGFFQ